MSRLDPQDRKNEILKAALRHAHKVGYQNVTREAIANIADCAPGLVTHYFNTMTQLKRAVMRAAVHDEILSIVAQGLAANDPQAKKAPATLKNKAVKSLTS